MKIYEKFYQKSAEFWFTLALRSIKLYVYGKTNRNKFAHIFLK